MMAPEVPWPGYYDSDPRMAWVSELDARFLAALTAPVGGYVPGPIPPPERTLGPQWVSWIARNCRMGEGDVFNRPPKVELWQRALLWKLAELEDDGRRRYGFAVVSMGKGSGKSPIGGWVGSVDLAGPSVCCPGCGRCDRGFKPNGLPHAVRRVSPDVMVIASSFEQADLILDEIRVTFGEGPLAEYANAMKGLVELKSDRGRARRIPATPKKADGSKATTLLVDEIHEFDTERREVAYNVASGGTAKRQDGLVLLLSTAGWDLASLFGRIVSRGLAGGFGRDELLVVMQADEGLAKKPDLSDDDIAEGIRQANPLAACGVANVRKLVSKFRSMPLYRAVRYYFNRWVPSDESWLPAGAWDACKGELVFDPSLPTWVGADMALRRDSAAVVIVQRRPDGRLQTSAKIWFPDGEPIDQTECDQYLREVCATHNVQWIAADEAWWPTLGMLEAEGLPIFRMPQQGKNMVIAYSRTYQAITGRVIVHDGAPDYSDQIASAAPHSSDGGWRLRKGKNKRRIDSCPALAGAMFATTLAPREVPKPLPRMGVI